MGVSKNRGAPKSSILIGFSIINHPFWGIPIFGNTHVHSETTIHDQNRQFCVCFFGGDEFGSKTLVLDDVFSMIFWKKLTFGI